MTPRTFTDGFGLTTVSPSVIGAFMSNLQLLAKWVKVYFSSANCMPCLRAHSRHISWLACRFRQLWLVVGPYASMLMSSANPTGAIGSPALSKASRSGLL